MPHLFPTAASAPTAYPPTPRNTLRRYHTTSVLSTTLTARQLVVWTTPVLLHVLQITPAVHRILPELIQAQLRPCLPRRLVVQQPQLHQMESSTLDLVLEVVPLLLQDLEVLDPQTLQQHDSL